jgi:hypothetical protein
MLVAATVAIMRAKTILSILVAATGFGGSALAQQDCVSDGDCPTGFECRVVGGSGCAEPDCAPDTDCPSVPPCEPVELTACVPGACASDSDCAEGMRCHEFTSGDCASSPTCAPGEQCDAGTPECRTTTESQCLPNWALPCQRDADCGDGFECVARQSCQCSGSGGVAEPLAEDAGKPDVAPSEQPDCSCEASDELYCRLLSSECQVDSDCPLDFTCETGGASTCSGGSIDVDPNSPDASVSRAAAADCEPSTDVRECTPPAYLRYVDVGSSHSGEGTQADDGVTAGDISPRVDAASDGFEGDTDSQAVRQGNDAVSCECALLGAPRGARPVPLAVLLGVALAFGAVRRGTRPKR